MGEDVDFSWRALMAGYVLRPAPSAVVQYRFRANRRSMMRQAASVGRSDADLFAKYRQHGLVAPSVRRVMRTWASLAVSLPQALVSPTGRGRWCRAVAYRWGRLTGSITRRVWYP